jgi:hypothetical protein
MNTSNDRNPMILIPVIDPTDFMEAYSCGCNSTYGTGPGGECDCGSTNGAGGGGKED